MTASGPITAGGWDALTGLNSGLNVGSMSQQGVEASTLRKSLGLERCKSAFPRAEMGCKTNPQMKSCALCWSLCVMRGLKKMKKSQESGKSDEGN